MAVYYWVYSIYISNKGSQEGCHTYQAGLLSDCAAGQTLHLFNDFS